MNSSRVMAVLRIDLRQLRRSKDFWIPMALLAGIFFVLIPTVLLLSISAIGNVHAVQQISQALNILPDAVKARIPGGTPQAQTSYALAVYLFAPLAIVVPLTISTAVGANIIVGERERGTGEFLAHSPAQESEIYLGKLIASVIPGLLATMIGFAIYSVIVNLIVGPDIGGGIFFPTSDWWILMFWVVPPFILLALSLVVRLSARVRSAAAAQQASALVTLPLILIAAGQTLGALFGAGAETGWLVGVVAWLAALLGISRGARSVTRERLLGIAPVKAKHGRPAGSPPPPPQKLAAPHIEAPPPPPVMPGRDP
jgi:ABC-type Na+ efflux pump permease subunit